MNKFNKLYLSIINEAKQKDYTANIEVLKNGLAKIEMYLKDAKSNDPHLSQFLDMKKQYEEQLKLYTEPATIILYGETKEFSSAANAMDYFYAGLKYCDPDSAEAFRYTRYYS
jgi:hypothetical protein